MGFAAGVADRLKHLTNHVAKRVDQAHPGTYVGVRAYVDHAMVPSIPLEPNVHVTLVPYNFAPRYTGFSPEDIIALWRDKAQANTPPNRLGLYDLSCSADRGGLPYCGEKALAERLRFWSGAAISDLTFEATTGAAAVAFDLLLTARFAWEGAADEDALRQDFCERAFGLLSRSTGG